MQDTIFHDYWSERGHTFGECMSGPNLDWMYVKIPKCASIWVRELLLQNKLEFYHYHKLNFYHKHALVVLRDPVDRWISGVCEYLTRYHRNLQINDINKSFIDLLMNIITVDDHTEKQIYFIEGLDLNNCTFLYCDDHLRENFASWMQLKQGVENQYQDYPYQNVGRESEIRLKFQKFIKELVKDSKYIDQLKQHYKEDYKLINSVQFYGSR